MECVLRRRYNWVALLINEDQEEIKCLLRIYFDRPRNRQCSGLPLPYDKEDACPMGSIRIVCRPSLSEQQWL